MAKFKSKLTYLTSIFFGGTPTMSAAVLWSIELGGIWVSVWVDMYLF